MILCESSDWVVREADFPAGVHGALMADADGRANIYVRSNDAIEEKRKTFIHEIAHFILGHPWSDRPVEELEDEVTSILMT